jgi:hypothetical protein
MPITKKQAKILELRIVRLLCWDIEAGNARRPKLKEDQPNIIYSLDDFEISTKVVKPTGKRKPEDIITCEKTGLPLRPVYWDDREGKVLRAIPISWREGVPYYDYRDATTGARD